MDLVMDPNLIYGLLVAGMMLAVLALFAPGTGLIELGALALLVIAGIGMINTPVNFWALLILLVGVFPFLLAMRQWKHWAFLLVSMAAMVVGSLFLFQSTNGLPAVHPVLAVSLSVLSSGFLWFIGRKGIEAMKKKPAHNLDHLTGMIGEARTSITNDGTVYVGGEEWSAESDELIPAGVKVVIVSRNGLILHVKPYKSEL